MVCILQSPWIAMNKLHVKHAFYTPKSDKHFLHSKYIKKQCIKIHAMCTMLCFSHGEQWHTNTPFIPRSRDPGFSTSWVRPGNVLLSHRTCIQGWPANNPEYFRRCEWLPFNPAHYPGWPGLFVVDLFTPWPDPATTRVVLAVWKGIYDKYFGA